MDATQTAFEEATRTLFKRVSSSGDQNIGSATQQTSSSGTQVVSTLAPVALVALVWLLVFIIIRPRASWKYAPRTQSKMLSQSAYTDPLPSGRFNWLPALWAIPDTFVLQHQSLDSYLFLRFLKLSVIGCLVGCCITWPVLFPVNATGHGGQSQLDILSMSNVTNPWRFWAHAGCACIYFGFLMFLITRESIFFINLRQAYLMQPTYASKLSSRTVLFTSVPDDYLNEAKLRDALGPQVVRVWLPTNTKELDDMVDERQKTAMKLEGAETKLIRAANEARLKAIKKGGAAQHDENNTDADGESGSVAARWITPKERPTHRLGKFGLYGQKVDSINWCRAELQKSIPKVDAEQEKHRLGQATKLRAVFVEFANLREAQAAYQSLTHHHILTMAPRFTGMHPSDVIWGNLTIRGGERYIRFALTTSFIVALIVFWSFPVALVGVISNINYLIGPQGKLPWLNWILKLPHVLLGIITGLLPTIMLAVLMALLPIILRLAARLGGAPTYSDVEYQVQNSYFAFQVIQAFIVTTLTSAASSAVVTILNHPSSITTLLSTSIPRASNFYLSYFVLQGLGVFAGTLVGIAGLFVTPLLVRILGSTPRKIWQRWNRLSGVGWGTLYPIYTNLFVISVCYSCIAPLVSGFAVIGLFLFYFAYRYNFLFVYDTGIDMKGLGYPRALQQLFVGIYIAEVCLLGLFATRLSNHGAIGPFVLMILLIVFTALYHVSLDAALTPLIKYLPKTLEAEERQSVLAAADGVTAAEAHDDVEAGTRVVDAEKPNPDTVTSPANNVLSPPAPHPKPNLFIKFFKPHVYNDYSTMRRLVPAMISPADAIDDGLVRDAYLPPSVWTDTPQLLIPRDEMGVSRQECRDTEKFGVACTDGVARLDEKNKIVVDDDIMSGIWMGSKEQLVQAW